MELPSLLRGGLKSNQTGFVSISNPAFGATEGEDGIYIDVTITAVNTAKAMVIFDGHAFLRTSEVSLGSLGFACDFVRAQTLNSDNGVYHVLMKARARLLNATTVRISSITNLNAATISLSECKFIGRWQVLESK